MYANPKEDRTRVDHILLEQFRRKGYKCEEVCKEDATIFIISHEKKTVTDPITQAASETYKGLHRNN